MEKANKTILIVFGAYSMLIIIAWFMVALNIFAFDVATDWYQTLNVVLGRVIIAAAAGLIAFSEISKGFTSQRFGTYLFIVVSYVAVWSIGLNSFGSAVSRLDCGENCAGDVVSYSTIASASMIGNIVVLIPPLLLLFWFAFSESIIAKRKARTDNKPGLPAQ